MRGQGEEQLQKEWEKGQHRLAVQSLSRVRLSVTPWTAAHQASLSITNSWSLLRLMSIESVMPSNHLLLCLPLLLLPSIFPSIRVFSNESALCIRWLKYWSFSFNVSSSNAHPGLISFRMDLLDLKSFLRDSQESSLTPQFKSISSLALSFLYSPTLTSIPDYWKNHSFDQTDLCWPSNVSAFEYAVLVGHSFSSKKQASYNFMAAVTMCSDFGAQENKVCHHFHLFPFYSP